MSHAIALRPSFVATSPVLLVIALFVLLLLGAPAARAAAQSQATATEQLEDDRFRDNHSPDYHRANAEYWRVKGERLTVRRKGLFGWLMPKRTRHELAEKQRQTHRTAASVHYRGRGGRKATVWQTLGLAD